MSADPPDEGDGFPDPDRVPATVPGVGDMQAGGPDQASIRLLDPTTGAGLFTTNTDPNVVGVDPITGEDAPAGTDVGFASSLRRFLMAGVYNGDFAVPPLDTSQPLSDANVLPYWTVFTAGSGSTTSYGEVIASSSPSGYSLRITGASAGAGDEWGIRQLVPVNGSSTRSFAYMPAAALTPSSVFGLQGFIRGQYLKADGTTTGSAVEDTGTVFTEVRAMMGQVPADAYYLQVDVGARNGSGTVTIWEVRCIAGTDHILVSDVNAGNDVAVIRRSNNFFQLGSVVDADGDVDTAEPNLSMAAGSDSMTLSAGTVNVSGDLAVSGATDLDGRVRFGGVIRPAPGSNQNDWNPTGLSTASVILCSPSASIDITGIVAEYTDDVDEGRVLILINESTANTITLKSDSASSTSQYRILTRTSVDQAIAPREGLMLVYDAGGNKWRVLSLAA